MARLPRFVIPGQPQHIIVRGNNREAIFYADVDYRYYLEKLEQACVKHHCAIHAYVLMANHVHFLISLSLSLVFFFNLYISSPLLCSPLICHSSLIPRVTSQIPILCPVQLSTHD